mgnify:CR=1 FL=1
MPKKVEAHQVPETKCRKQNCTGDIRWGIFYWKGFENDKIKIGNVCSNKLCKKNDIGQYDPRKTEQENEDALTPRWVPFASHGLWINPENWEELKLSSKELAERKVMKIEKKAETCGCKGCNNTDVEKHHIMPKGYCDLEGPEAMDADDWPLVVLCSYHHMRWHATLTAGLTQRADSYNWANLPKFYKMLDEAGIDAHEDENYWNRLTAYKDLREALHAEAKAKQACDAAMKRVEHAKFTLEHYLLLDEENAEYET